MKEKLIKTSFVVFLFLTALSALTLGVEHETLDTAAQSPYRYVFLAPNKEEEYWAEVASGVKAQDQEEGSDTLLVQDKNENLIANYLMDARLSGAKGVILKGTNEANEEIQKMTEEGIPVIFYNSDFPESGRTAYVGHDNYEIGRLSGELLVQTMGEKGSVFVFARTYLASTMKDRLRGFLDYLKDYPHVQTADFIEDRGNLLTLREAFYAALEKEDKIQGMVSFGGMATDHLGDLLENVDGKEEMAVIVTDLSDNSAAMLEKGVYDAVISLDASEIGRKAVELLNAHDREGKELPSEVMLDLKVVTKENLPEYLFHIEEKDWEWNSYEP